MILAWGGCRFWFAAVAVATMAWAAGLDWPAAAQAQPHQHGQGQAPQGKPSTPRPPAPTPPGWTPLKELHDDFEEMIHTAPQWRRPGRWQKADMFQDFLAWPRNPVVVELTVRLTFPGGVGPTIGSLTIKNGEILVGGRKEVALVIAPDVRGLPQGRYAFHVHEKANCGSALKDGKEVPGLAAGEHLWNSGTGDLKGTTFTSHLGDLPDLEVGTDGNANTLVVAARLTLADVAGRAFMIHASQDDASERLACAAFD
jgi:superoxide dismutase, Cu-Zn family